MKANDFFDKPFKSSVFTRGRFDPFGIPYARGRDFKILKEREGLRAIRN